MERVNEMQIVDDVDEAAAVEEIVVRDDEWQVAIVKKPKRERKVGCCFSINKRGEISMNRAAFSKMAGRLRVILYYCPKSHSIGINGSWNEEDQAFPVKRHGRTRNSFVIRAGRLLKQFGIEITETLYFRDVTPLPHSYKAPHFVLDLDQNRKAVPYVNPNRMAGF